MVKFKRRFSNTQNKSSVRSLKCKRSLMESEHKADGTSSKIGNQVVPGPAVSLHAPVVSVIIRSRNGHSSPLEQFPPVLSPAARQQRHRAFIACAILEQGRCHCRSPPAGIGHCWGRSAGRCPISSWRLKGGSRCRPLGARVGLDSCRRMGSSLSVARLMRLFFFFFL